MIGIYIHIPFCRIKCPYCDFLSEAVAGDIPDAFIAALKQQIRAWEGPEDAISIYLGGGTPSLLRLDQIEMVLHTVEERFRLHDPEITLEANPGDVSPARAAGWRAAGVNRVSLGVQHFDDRVLRYLGRRHDARTAEAACGTVAACFKNWSMDLIYGAPPIAAWLETLRRCRALAPPHVSAYSLTWENSTPFAARRGDAPEDDTSLALYRHAETALAQWEHYEISNWSGSGGPSRHNLIYWRNEEYAGFGPGAYAFIGGVRSRNTVDIRAWMKEPLRREEALTLTEEEIRVETLIQHFRLRAGIEKTAYRHRFSRDLMRDYGGVFTALIRRGLIEDTGGALRPAREGFYLNNEIGLALVESGEEGAAACPSTG
jgi:oxygen-independent coproporphyrinogen III oxidase